MTVQALKNLTRIFVPETGFSGGKNILLSESQVHYLRNVMRKNAGDQLRVFNGRDGEWLTSIKEINKNKIIIEIDYQILKQESSPDVWVFVSPVKKEAFDLMVEKACELGASKFVPVVCEHTVVHRINQERLQAIAVEAAEQSERMDVMEVAPLTSLADVLKSAEEKRNILWCLERNNSPPLLPILTKLKAVPLAVLIGPEGGFSVSETTLLKSKKGVFDVSLGSRILKTETALISALSCVQLTS